jgi:CHAD domain-containing protein
MSYRLRVSEPIAAGARRIATEQVDAVLRTLDDRWLSPDEAVHDVRERCKRVRALLRLVRPAFGARYDGVAARYGDAARALAAARDAAVLVDAYDGLIRHFRREVERRAFAPVRRALTLRRRALTDGGVPARLAGLREAMEQARSEVETWSLDGDGYDALRRGLQAEHRRGRWAFRAAYAGPSDERFHTWRKRVKDHGYHARLLRDAWTPVGLAWAGEAERLAGLLGDEHDLAVLAQTLRGEPDRFGRLRAVQALLGLIDRRRGELQARARPLGGRLYAERPGAFAARLEEYWNAACEEAEPAALALPCVQTGASRETPTSVARAS